MTGEDESQPCALDLALRIGQRPPSRLMQMLRSGFSDNRSAMPSRLRSMAASFASGILELQLIDKDTRSAMSCAHA